MPDPRSHARPEDAPLLCSLCNRGRDACEWCHDLAPLDFETICDCGLYDFGRHLFECAGRAEKKWVVRQ